MDPEAGGRVPAPAAREVPSAGLHGADAALLEHRAQGEVDLPGAEESPRKD